MRDAERESSTSDGFSSIFFIRTETVLISPMGEVDNSDSNSEISKLPLDNLKSYDIIVIWRIKNARSNNKTKKSTQASRTEL
jgi:hypothetical protein